MMHLHHFLVFAYELSYIGWTKTNVRAFIGSMSKGDTTKTEIPDVAVEAAFDCGEPALVVVPIDYNENMKLTKRLGDIACPI